MNGSFRKSERGRASSPAIMCGAVSAGSQSEHEELQSSLGSIGARGAGVDCSQSDTGTLNPIGLYGQIQVYTLQDLQQ
ncbi:hypothetical protein VZT92_002999 [Zoarces viviparus]|uniref:Uncharacterized protein n=1 Tax=Zoarces viviparus TaxID=48416 RepID=A0AAW1G1X0_ZOAVI